MQAEADWYVTDYSILEAAIMKSIQVGISMGLSISVFVKSVLVWVFLSPYLSNLR